ncbi:hypothetical protein BDM02DRAFT_3191695 [Thelephora ganbajun]|uniref:Uncharacterized protein n=1 Tax=Thelephora ganbajun TaxID=370292 RepID=A0ACB6Z1I7_THEGA|nr:hypothetical protein BDM02DRAFT_3191695 [Thelephora ganbajun]
MKRWRRVTKCTVTVEKANGASIYISHVQNVRDYTFADEGVEEERDRDDGHVFSDAIALVRKLPLHWIRKFVLEDLKADEMSKPESFEIPPALVELICSDMPNLATLILTRTCVSEFLKVLTPPPPPPPTYIADLFDPDATYGPGIPCPTLKVLELQYPTWAASRHCREALELTKARKHERVPLDRVFLCFPSVQKAMVTSMSSYVDDIDVRKCNGCE